MQTPPTFESTTRLVARALGMSVEALLTGFRRASLNDLPAVVEFRRSDFGERIRWDDAEYLQWRYRLDRPDCGLGDLWVLFKDERLVGIVGAEDMVCIHAGQRYSGARTMDILVAESARHTGLGIWLNQAMFRNGAFTLAVGGNANSVGTVKRLYRPLAARQEYVQPIDLSSFMHRRLGRGPLIAVAITLGNLAIRGWRRISALASGGQIQIRSITRFDNSTATLPDPGGPDQIQIEHSAAYLNRRLFDNPRAGYVVSGAYRAGLYMGYIAWRNATRQDGERMLYIIDWQTRADDRDATLRALLDFVGRQAEDAACDFVLLTAQSQDQRRVFRHAGFFARKGGGHQIVGIHANVQTLLGTLSAARWSLTGLSEDYDGY